MNFTLETLAAAVELAWRLQTEGEHPETGGRMQLELEWNDEDGSSLFSVCFRYDYRAGKLELGDIDMFAYDAPVGLEAKLAGFDPAATIQLISGLYPEIKLAGVIVYVERAAMWADLDEEGMPVEAVPPYSDPRWGLSEEEILEALAEKAAEGPDYPTFDEEWREILRQLP